jgi:prepilin-type processing-associated H-X9-DG protein
MEGNKMKTRKVILLLVLAIAVALAAETAAFAVPLPQDLSGYYKVGYFDGEHAVKVEMGDGSIKVYVLPDLEKVYLGVISGDEIFFTEESERWGVVKQVNDTVALLTVHDSETGEIKEFSIVRITEAEANEIAEREELAQTDQACANNLKQLGLALHLFARDHANEMPLDLSELYPNYVRDNMLFVCPVRGGEFHSFDQDYEYIPGFSLGSPNPDQEAVIIEMEGNHVSPLPSHHVLYLDGHVELISDMAY